MKISEYRRVIDPIIQPSAWKPSYSVLVHTVVHLSLITGIGLEVAWHVHSWPLWAILLLGAFCGHSMACLGFCAHEIEHGAAVKNRLAIYLWETAAWIYTGTTCASIHRKAHFAHHAYLNSSKDPNARPTVEEAQQDPDIANVLSEWLFPNGKHPIGSAFLGLWFVNQLYQMKLLFHSLLRTGHPRFDMKVPVWQAWSGFIETFVVNLGVYVALWAAAGFHWKMAVFLFTLSYVGTIIALMYICTNHLLNPTMSDHVDPLELSLTLRVPGWVDFLHQSFSQHNEHHLYPKAGPRNYPAIRQALKEYFPERYNEMGFFAAYAEILRSPLAIAGRNSLSDPWGRNPREITFPAKDAEPAVAVSA